MSARTIAICGGLAVIAAVVSNALVHDRPSEAPGGHYDERGHWVVPLTPDLQKQLGRLPPPRHPRESAIIDRVQKRIREGKPEQLGEALLSFPAGSRYVWATFWVEAEVDNGGFDQYFANGHGPAARTAIEGFRAFGAEPYAVLVEKAIAVHESGGKDEAIDDAFFALEEREPPATLRAKYIDAHPEEFPQ